jgi:hypothetical protein
VVQVLLGFVAGCAFTAGVLLVVQGARPALRRRHHELAEPTERDQPTPTAGDLEAWLHGR